MFYSLCNFLTFNNYKMEEIKEFTVGVETALKRIEELKTARETVRLESEKLEGYKKDFEDNVKVYGPDAKQCEVIKERIALSENTIADAQKKIDELSFTKSCLKPVLDEAAKQFEDALRSEQSKEYHIEIASKDDEHKNNGKKVFKQLLDYLYNNVRFTPKTAANLMVLVRNMEENKLWVNSKEFDNVIILRSANVLNLWRFILEDMEGKGFYEARTFLECWANCGQSVSDAVRMIQKEHTTTQKLGTDLNTIESEFDNSFDDLPKDEESLSTKDEVDPEVGE